MSDSGIPRGVQADAVERFGLLSAAHQAAVLALGADYGDEEAMARAKFAADKVEEVVRRRVAAELIYLRRTEHQVKGQMHSTKRYHVNQALIEGALRVMTDAHAEDEYPDGWLDGIDVRAGDEP